MEIPVRRELGFFAFGLGRLCFASLLCGHQVRRRDCRHRENLPMKPIESIMFLQICWLALLSALCSVAIKFVVVSPRTSVSRRDLQRTAEKHKSYKSFLKVTKQKLIMLTFLAHG